MGCNCLLIAGELSLCVWTLVSIVASSTTFWKVSVGAENVYTDLYLNWGLYTWCIEYGIQTSCDSIENPRDYLVGCRILINIAVILLIGSVLVSWVYLCKLSNRTATKSMLMAIIVMAAIAVAFLFIVTIIYGASYNEDEDFDSILDLVNIEWDIGSSFVANIIAASGLFVTCFLLWFSYSPEQVQPQGVIIINNPVPQPGYVLPAQPMPPGYAQPPYYGQAPQPYPTTIPGQPVPMMPYGPPAQPNPFTTAASGEAVAPPPSYGQK